MLRFDIDSADALAKQQTLDPIDVGGSLAHQTLPLGDVGDGWPSPLVRVAPTATLVLAMRPTLH